MKEKINNSMVTTLDKQELQHILGGFDANSVLELGNNCNGIGNCSTCKKGCQTSCITGQTSGVITGGQIAPWLPWNPAK